MAGTAQPLIAELGLHVVPLGSSADLALSVGTAKTAVNRCGFYAVTGALGTEQLGLIAGGVEVARFHNSAADSTVYLESLGYAVLAEHLRLGDIPVGYTPVDGDLSYTGTTLRLRNGGAWETLVTTGSGAAGLDTYVQYNDSGGLGASASFTYNDATKVLTLGDASSEPVLALVYDITDVLDREASITWSLGSAITEKRDLPGPLTRFDIISACQVTALQGSGGVGIASYSTATGTYEYANGDLLFNSPTATLANYELALSVGLVNNGFETTPLTATAVSETISRAAVAFVQTVAGITTTLWAGPSDGDTVMIRNDSGGGTTVAANAGDTIEGAATFGLIDGEALTLKYRSATSNWLVF